MKVKIYKKYYVLMKNKSPDAKEKFQEVQKAYEIIQKERGI